MYRWVIFTPILAIFGFLLAHGAAPTEPPPPSPSSCAASARSSVCAPCSSFPEA